MKKKIITIVVVIGVIASLLGIAHVFDFVGMIKKLHGG